MKNLPLLTAALIILSGCLATAPQPTPVSDPTRRLEFPGFSVQSPPGEGWFMLPPKEGQVGFIKAIGSKNHTFSTYVFISSLPEEAHFETPDDFLIYVKRENERASTPRFWTLEGEEVLDTTLAPYCVRHNLKVADRGALLTEIPILEIHSYSCLHPDSPKWFINLGYSDRSIQGWITETLREEGEAFIKNFKFAPMK
ncbi:MAG: hypothetical protein HZA18_04305 [Nitrospirae bacterium]|nr:hypothetical protein [Nitrospirota bacterium]